MYNSIGLQTPRGSGTNGYTQRGTRRKTSSSITTSVGLNSNFSYLRTSSRWPI
uniref:Uncharacterized protein n=1 Tax=Cucumis sativus TaxID=3659 RepID=A0A0A0LM38_CUCSA